MPNTATPVRFSEQGRSGTRMLVAMPVTISGRTESGKPFEEKTRTVVLKRGATVEELVRALPAIGSTPRDIIAVLQSLRSAGALEADLEVI